MEDEEDVAGAGQNCPMPASAKSVPPEKTTSPPAAAPAAPGAGLSAVQRALRKLGLVRDIDFALYLPMRYEDETRIVRLADTRDGDMAQVEGVVTECEVVYRPRAPAPSAPRVGAPAAGGRRLSSTRA